MGSKFLQSYIDDNKTLIKTLVIKSSIASSLINSFIKLKYGTSFVDDNNPSSWKYYKNISGLYHETDIPMSITSLDTLEQILFTKESLAIHTTTAKAYQYGSRYYYSLLNKYPEQEQLILGILYPADITTAIAAEDGTILAYPKYLVEEQEISLISELEDFIKRHMSRWNVKAYGITDSLYHASYFAILVLNLYPKILNLRLKRCKTYEAHSFHIREYLASHTNLDAYIPYLTLKQKLWLYRNIRYIFRNSGKIEQFKVLVQKLLSDRRIPLNEFSVRHESTFDDNLLPNILIRRKAINDQFNVPEKKYLSVDDLYNVEKPLVYGNIKYLDINSKSIEDKFKLSPSNAIQTKDLESNMLDYNDAVPITLESVLLSLWINLVDMGYYNNVVVNFKDPKTSEIITLYSREALIYMNYISLKSAGITPVNVPLLLNNRSNLIPKPDVETLLSVVDTAMFPDLKTIAEEILAGQPDISPIFSNSAFFELGFKLYQETRKHWFRVSYTEDHYKRALVANMISSLYDCKYVDVLDTPLTMEQFLNRNNLKPYNYTLAEANDLIANIFEAATGIIIDQSKLLKNIQRAMITIMSKLSSYSVQYINNINDSGIRPINWAAIRLGNIIIDTKQNSYINHGIRVTDINSVYMSRSLIEPEINDNYVGTYSVYKDTQEIDIGIVVVSDISVLNIEVVRLPNFYVVVDYPEKDDEISSSSKFIGWEYYLSLTDEQKSQIKSIHPLQ